MRQRRTLLAGGFLSGLLVMVSCAPNGSLGEVSGTVTIDGEPVPSGSINFIPLDGNGGTAGSAIKDGKYTARKVSVGLMKVTIKGSKIIDKIKQEDSPDRPYKLVMEDIVPAKYNEQSELTFEVKPGNNEKDFHLQR